MTISGVSDVPVADNLGPFEQERWFDGSRVREQASAKELHDLFLSPLGFSRKDCWITDLVKVFLFKHGHIERYAKLNTQAPEGYRREKFQELAQRSLPWIAKELHAAKPALVITLGAEVAGVVRGIVSPSARLNLLRPVVERVDFGGMEIPMMHCAHPGILMRPNPKNVWPERHANEFVPVLKKAVKELMRG